MFNAMTDRSKLLRPAQRDPVFAARGRGGQLNTVPSGIPKALRVGYDGCARYSAEVHCTCRDPLREGRMMQRWYRIVYALCPKGRRAFFVR